MWQAAAAAAGGTACGSAGELWRVWELLQLPMRLPLEACLLHALKALQGMAAASSSKHPV